MLQLLGHVLDINDIWGSFTPAVLTDYDPDYSAPVQWNPKLRPLNQS